MVKTRKAHKQMERLRNDASMPPFAYAQVSQCPDESVVSGEMMPQVSPVPSLSVNPDDGEACKVGPHLPTEEGSNDIVDDPSSPWLFKLKGSLVKCAQSWGYKLDAKEDGTAIFVVLSVLAIVALLGSCWLVTLMFACLVAFVTKLCSAAVVAVQVVVVISLFLGILAAVHEFSVRKRTPSNRHMMLVLTLAVMCGQTFMGQKTSWLIPFGSGFVSGVFIKNKGMDNGNPEVDITKFPSHKPTTDPADFPSHKPTNKPATDPADFPSHQLSHKLSIKERLDNVPTVSPTACAEHSPMRKFQDSIVWCIKEKGGEMLALSVAKLSALTYSEQKTLKAK
jgi:hypothetical protein